MGGTLRLDGARVAIAEGVGERFAVGIDADVVDGPAIDGDGANAFGGDFGALAHAFFEAADDVLEIPVQAAVDLAGIVGEAMDQFDGRAAVVPAQQGDAAAFSAQIDCNRGSAVVRLQWSSRELFIALPHAYLRKASVKPPSTGMMWPVVQGVLGPARKRIAWAQSLGSMAGRGQGALA